MEAPEAALGSTLAGLAEKSIKLTARLTLVSESGQQGYPRTGGKD
jgi:hypothetical protein